jgi:hypothetical protein
LRYINCRRYRPAWSIKVTLVRSTVNGIKLSYSSLRYQCLTKDMTGFIHERELLRSPLFNSRLIPIGT